MADVTARFKSQLEEAFRELQPGKVFTWRRTFTEGDVSLFCGVTGDFNPYHLDNDFCRETWFGRCIIPGLLTGSMLTHIGGMLGFLATDMTFQFLLPVYAGDTVTCTVTILERDEAKRRFHADAHFTNQKGEQVVVSRFSGFPSQIRLSH